MRARGPLQLAGALVAASLALAAPASAQTVRLDDLAGRWSLQTGPQPRTQCVIRANVSGVRAGNRLHMDMRAIQSCPNAPRAYTAHEDCFGTLSGATLTVRCTVVSADPADYNADQFALNVVSANELTGRLIDGGSWDVPVRWTRPSGPLVS